jgi:hypothetical protein
MLEASPGHRIRRLLIPHAYVLPFPVLYHEAMNQAGLDEPPDTPVLVLFELEL